MLMILVLTTLGLLGGQVELGNCERYEMDGFCGLKHLPYLADLNDWLVDNVKSKDPEANFEAVRDLYKANLKKLFRANKKVLGAEKLFLALGSIKDSGNMCTEYSIKVLTIFEYAAGGRRWKNLDSNESLRRIDQIFKDYLQLHFDECKSVYAERFKQKIASFDKQHLEYINDYFDEAIKVSTSDEHKVNVDKSQARRLFNLADGWIYTEPSKKPDYVRRQLNRMAKDDPLVKYLQPVADEKSGYMRLDQSGFQKLFDKYVGTPCSNYVSQFGPDLFELAPHDMKFERSLDENNVEYMRGWAIYKLCDGFQIDVDTFFRRFGGW